MKNVLTFCLLLFSFFAFSQDPLLKPFYHGVASGDALSDQVIIWTRVSDTTGTVSVDWRMATDTLFANVVQSGNVNTDASKDFTVKIDVTGLLPDTWYYYQFSVANQKSLTGRTKTLPVGNNQRIRLAVASCQSYSAGVYYNAWLSIATRNDIHAVLHLGDYIYEGGGSGPTGSGVTVQPDHEIMTLQDYRERYSSYRLDPYLRRAHQQYAFYTTWDDHEVVNNAWENPSDNNFQTRKANAQQAYFEWMPIREKAPGNYSVYRAFSFGNLADLVMLDTRHEGRDEQVATTNTGALQDTNRTILGVTQRQWFFDQLDNSTAQWKVAGQQVMIAPLRVFGAYVNADQWDGYQGDRNRLINHVVDNAIENVVLLTGDIHTAWANDVPQEGVTYDPNTGAGSAFVEFICTSISSGSSLIPMGIEGLVIGQNPHVKWVNLTQRGYAVLDLDTGRAQSDWYIMSSTTNASFTVDSPASWFVNKGERFLREATTTASGYSNSAPFAPLTIDTINTGITEISNLPVSVFPNPFEQNIFVQLKQPTASPVTVMLFNIHGKIVYEQSFENSEALSGISVDTHQLPAADYLLSVESGNAMTRVVVVKAR